MRYLITLVALMGLLSCTVAEAKPLDESKKYTVISVPSTLQCYVDYQSVHQWLRHNLKMEPAGQGVNDNALIRIWHTADRSHMAVHVELYLPGAENPVGCVALHSVEWTTDMTKKIEIPPFQMVPPEYSDSMAPWVPGMPFMTPEELEEFQEHWKRPRETTEPQVGQDT